MLPLICRGLTKSCNNPTQRCIMRTFDFMVFHSARDPRSGPLFSSSMEETSNLS